MCQVWAIGFLALLFFDVVQTRKCFHCRNVTPENVCIGRETTCEAGMWTYCFTRKVVRDDSLTWVHRGCARQCINLQTKKRIVHMECCTEEHCNIKNLWNVPV